MTTTSAHLDPDRCLVLAAIFGALADQRWEHAVGLVELHWADLAMHASFVIRIVARALPETQRNRSPRWQRLATTTRLLVRSAPAPVESEEAGQGEFLLRLDVLTAEARSALENGEPANARMAARRAVAHFRAVAGDRRGAIGRRLPRYLLEWARILRAVDGDPEGRTLLEEAYAWSIGIGESRAAVEAASELAADDALLGRTETAALWAERATLLHQANTGDADSPPAVKFALACAAADRLDFTGALALLDQVATVPAYDRDRVVASFRVLWSSLRSDADRPSLAADLDRACVQPAWSRLGDIGERFARVRLDLLDGYRHRAVRRLDPASGGRLSVWISAGRAGVNLRLGDTRAAELDASFALERVADAPRCDVELHVIQASLHLRRSNVEGARNAFRDAVTLAEVHSLPAALLAAPLIDLRTLADITYPDQHPPLLEQVLAVVQGVEAADRAAAKLTVRELAVVEALAAAPDASLAEVAVRMGVSKNTVKSQLRSIYRKAGTSDRRTLLEIIHAG